MKNTPVKCCCYQKTISVIVWRYPLFDSYWFLTLRPTLCLNKLILTLRTVKCSSYWCEKVDFMKKYNDQEFRVKIVIVDLFVFFPVSEPFCQVEREEFQSKFGHFDIFLRNLRNIRSKPLSNNLENFWNILESIYWQTL
jgi:hypothetical protein